MDNGFIWKGMHSKYYGVVCESLPSLDTPEERIEKQIIPGRDGFLTLKDGSYDSDVKPVTFHLIKEGLVDQIKAWLTGTDKVTFSTQPDRYYKASIISKVNLEEIIPILHKGIVQWDTQPFGYLFSGEDLTTITTSGDIIGNLGNYKSEPYLKIYGSGNIVLTVDDQVLIISNVVDYVEIDTELDQIFKGATSMENNSSGDCPFFDGRSSTITWTGTVTKIEIIPRWRCL